MRKKLKSINNNLPALVLILFILILWQGLWIFEIIPKFMLPSPVGVAKAFIKDFPLLMAHTKVTLTEAFIGLFCGIVIGFITAVFMDSFKLIHGALYPILIMTQTVPTVAIAPLLVLWLGYGIAPKIVLIIITTFFPIAIGMLSGFANVDKDAIKLLKAMGANSFQIFIHIKLPGSLSQLFSAVKISASYAVVGAVISEWLGGFNGLGVYMTRVKKSYNFDKMFAVIFLISAISLLLMWLISIIEKRCMPWIPDEQEKTDYEKV